MELESAAPPQPQVAGQLAGPPRRPPTAVGLAGLPPRPPEPPGPPPALGPAGAPGAGPPRYHMPQVRRAALLMLALLLGAAGVGVAALPPEGGPALTAGRALVSAGLGAAGGAAAWRAAPPPEPAAILRAARRRVERERDEMRRRVTARGQSNIALQPAAGPWWAALARRIIERARSRTAAR